MNLTEELAKIKKHRVAVLPPPRRTNPDEEIVRHPTPKGFPTTVLQLFGRPKKLAKWGFRLENDIPGKVRRIL